jgi:DNA invertase Pin-like site-specific DNA recombinase
MFTTAQSEQKATQVRAAMYVRSAAYNETILRQQADLLEVYAERHDLCIVRRYVEGGKPYSQEGGLKPLMAVVRNGTADFSAIILRDCTRWGRLPSPDVTAWHEHVCREANIDVHYVEEEHIKNNNPPPDLSPAPYIERLKSVLKR